MQRTGRDARTYIITLLSCVLGSAGCTGVGDLSAGVREESDPTRDLVLMAVAKERLEPGTALTPDNVAYAWQYPAFRLPTHLGPPLIPAMRTTGLFLPGEALRTELLEDGPGEALSITEPERLRDLGRVVSHLVTAKDMEPGDPITENGLFLVEIPENLAAEFGCTDLCAKTYERIVGCTFIASTPKNTFIRTDRLASDCKHP